MRGEERKKEKPGGAVAVEETPPLSKSRSSKILAAGLGGSTGASIKKV
jgi:ribosomal protein S17